MANLSIFEDMPPVQMKERMIKFVTDEFSQIASNDDHPFWKSRAKAQDRYAFIEGGK